MRAAVITNRQVSNVIELADDADLSAFAGELVVLKDNQNIGSGYMYDGQRFYAPVDDLPDDSPVTSAITDATPDTEGADGDGTIGTTTKK